MKANEAPKKIYIDPVKMAETESVVLSIVPDFRVEDNDIEYTRTDAFIEKAENFLEMLGYGFTITDNITHKNYDKEQLIEDFRKYMEGE